MISPLPAIKQKQILKLRQFSAQFLSACGLALLQQGVKYFTEIDFDPGKLEFPKDKKPRYPAKLDFNISHSGNIVCCAISETNQVGIDIEVHRKVAPSLKDKILGHQDSAQTFFDIWTKNEAIIKAACHGSVFNMKDISLNDQGGSYQGKFWYCYNVEVEADYTCHVATDAENVEIDTIQITSL